MDIQQLKYFSSVYETLNYAKAADKLFISRQGLRSAVQSLETELGVELFDHDRNKLVPTSAGTRLYEVSREALKAFRTVEDTAESFKTAPDRKISFGRSREIEEIIPQAVHDKLAAFPSWNKYLPRMRFFDGTCQEVRERILDGRLDYANIAATQIDDSLFDYEVGAEGTICLAVNRRHPLADRETVTIDDLRGLALTVQGEGFDIFDTVQAEALAHHFSLRVENIVSTIERSLLWCDDVGPWPLTAALYYYETVPDELSSTVVAIPFAEDSLRWKFVAIAKKGMGDRELLRIFSGQKLPSRVF